MPPRPPLTHFLCFPLVNSISRSQLQTSLSRFAADVSKLNGNGQPQIPPRAIRPIGAIHLTIGVMSLETPDRVEEACQFLRNLDIWELLRAAVLDQSHQALEADSQARGPNDEESSNSPHQPLSSLLPEDLSLAPKKPEPVVVALTNLLPMQSPSSTSSLYASPNPLHPLLPFAQRLHDAFLAAGFLLPPPSNRSLKMHASLVNTVYVRQSTGGKNRWGKGSGRIDARDVIEHWGETTWAEDVRVEKVAICRMGAKRIKDEEGKVLDEVYEEVASVNLP